MTNSGFSEEEAKSIVANYEKLYKVSIDWVNNKLVQAAKDGYVSGAFGLKLRTPIMKQVLWGKKQVPYEAMAESRTAGNMLSGQSFGLLNNRAQNEFMDRVSNSEFKQWIHPIAAIHDAQYYLIKEDIEILKFVNDNLIECMTWNADPDIYHPGVGLGGNLEIFYPSWAESTKVPNKASLEEIIQILQGLNNEI